MTLKSPFCILVSAISIIIMVVLFWIEFANYLSPNVTEELFVDTSRSPTIQIKLDIIFPKISCDCKSLMTTNADGAD